MTSPFGKRQLILECSRSIAQELESIAKSASAGVADSVSYITADEFIAVFNYVLIRASEQFAFDHNLTLLLNCCFCSDVSTMASQLHYTRLFSSKDDLFGESGWGPCSTSCAL